MNFCPLNLNVARFARNVEWDFFCDFQTACKACFLRIVMVYCIVPGMMSAGTRKDIHETTTNRPEGR